MTYSHPVSGQEIEGVRLGPGMTLIPEDQYDSTDGKWRPVPCPGSEIRHGCRTMVIRPNSATMGNQMWTISYFDILHPPLPWHV